MNAETLEQHQWLRRFVGEWVYEHEAQCDPDRPPVKMTGKETVRMLGDLWAIAEGEGDTPEGGTATTMTTFGYDAAKQRFVGSFVASMMTNIWIYEGDREGSRLILNTEGPDMTDHGKTTAYRDIYELVSDDHRTLTAQAKGPNGEWVTFMNAHYRRVK